MTKKTDDVFYANITAKKDVGKHTARFSNPKIEHYDIELAKIRATSSFYVIEGMAQVFRWLRNKKVFLRTEYVKNFKIIKSNVEVHRLLSNSETFILREDSNENSEESKVQVQKTAGGF